MIRIPNGIPAVTALVFVAVIALCASGVRSTSAGSPPELGDVRWLRDFDTAVAESKSTGRPLLVLFDEVPGCATCVRYGRHVLSHALIVEAAETLFVPVAVYNNVDGADREVLRSFDEPTWNNPVVRIIDHERRPLTDRIAGRYSRNALVAGMIGALESAGREVPGYLRLIQAEFRAEEWGTKTATFAMHCFWSGESCLAAIEGVTSTRTGFQSGREVVEVTYEPKVVSEARLAEQAAKARCSSELVVTGKLHPSAKDDKYRLRHSPWKHVPMTPLQAARANSSIARREDPSVLFSPRQIAVYRAAVADPSRRLPVPEPSHDLKAHFDAAGRRSS